MPTRSKPGWQLLRTDVEKSVALVTSAIDGVRASGTAFCVRQNVNGAFLVTCRHVVTDLDAGSGEVRVNGFPAVEIANGDDIGIDMSILSVAGATFSPLSVALNKSVALETEVRGLGFRHLHGDHYFSNPVQGRIDRVLTVRKQLSRLGSPSFRVAADKGFEFHPGLSGSPLCNVKGEVIGVLAFSSQDGSLGYVLSIEAAPKLLPVLLPPGKAAGSSNQLVDDVPPPPPLPKVRDEHDLQAGRFGGKNNDGAVALSVELQRVVGTSYFIFDAIVRAVKSTVRVVGPARFYLHDTYPRSMIQVQRPEPDNSIQLKEIHSYGVYTLGCQVYCSDRKWHRVELDLYTLGKTAKLPKAFLNR